MYKKRLSVDIITLHSFLQDNGLLETVGGTKILIELVNYVPNLLYLEEYISLINDKYLRRCLIKLEYKVILRTHPEATKRSQKTINRVRKNLQNYKNFEINTDISNLKPLSESSLLITDDGGIALEYYIIYKKPVLYINYLEKIHNLYFDKIKINTIEKEFKNEIGTSMDLSQLENLEYFIKKTKYDFKNKREKITDLVDKNEFFFVKTFNL